MKKVLLFFSLLLCLVIGSCSEDDSPEIYNIVGYWQVTEYSPDAGKTWKPWINLPTYLQFKTPDKFGMSGYFGEMTGRWTQNGNHYECRSNDGLQNITFSVKSCVDGICVLNVISINGNMYVKAIALNTSKIKRELIIE